MTKQIDGVTRKYKQEATTVKICTKRQKLRKEEKKDGGRHDVKANKKQDGKRKKEHVQVK